MDHMKVSQPAHGMWPTVFDLNTGKPINSKPCIINITLQPAELKQALHTVGAWADSAVSGLLFSQTWI